MDPLRQWAVKAGNMKIHADIVAQSIPSMGGGMGIVATKPIGAGHVLVQVPLAFMLTTRTARDYLATLSPPPHQLDALTPVETIMSFLMLAERDAQHVHYPWLRALPRRYDNLLELPYHSPTAGTEEGDDHSALYSESICPYVWSTRCREKCVEERLRFESSVRRCRERIPQLRRGPSVTHAVFEGRNEDEEEAAAQLAASSPSAVPVDKFLWAYNSLMSRGFAYDEDIWTMMPWVDYFNYSLFPNLTMRYNNGNKKYEFITKKKILAGEQLMLQYGSYSDYELALWYGFTLRRVLFPDCKPTRSTSQNGGESGVSSLLASSSTPASVDASNDLEQTTTLNTHFAYVFSPTYDPNGDLPIGLAWAVTLVVSAGLTPPPEWGATIGHDEVLHDVRIAWGSVSSGMAYLVRQLVEHNDLPSEEILRRIAAAELKSFSQGSPSPALPATREGSGASVQSPAMAMAIDMSEDHYMLLHRYAVELDSAALKRLLIARK